MTSLDTVRAASTSGWHITSSRLTLGRRRRIAMVGVLVS